MSTYPAATVLGLPTLQIPHSFPPWAAPPPNINPDWWPINSAQQAALNSWAEMLLFGGQSGGGKSDFLVGDAMQEYRIPTFRGLLLRESLGEFDQIGDRMETAYLPLKARYRTRSGGGQWIFPSGARIRFGYLASDRDLSKYRGNPYSWLGIDESGLHPEKRVRQMIAWLAAVDKRLRVRARFASNPGGDGHGWQMSVFLRNRCPLHYPPTLLDNRPAETSTWAGRVYSGASWTWPPSPANLVHMTTAFFPAAVTDNPLYGQDKVNKLLSQTPEIQMQLLKGCWCNAESLYFGFLQPEFKAAYPSIQDEWWWNHFLSIDYGYGNSSAAAGRFAVNEYGRVFGTGELVEKKMSSVDFAKKVCALWVDPRQGEEKPRMLFVTIDPANDQHHGTGKSNFELMEEVFAEHGVSCIKSHKGPQDNAQNLYNGLAGRMIVLTDAMSQTFNAIATRTIDERRAVKKIHGDPADDLYDMCLEAGTQISTERGLVPIEQVTTADRVWTRTGLRQILWSGKTKEDAAQVRVDFSDGRSLTGTGNHPVLVCGKGFTRLDSLACGDEVTTWENMLRRWCTEGSPSGDTRIHRAGTIAVISALGQQTARRESRICTVRYSKTSTAKFPMASPFITKTRTYPITTLQTLNLLKDRSTHGATSTSALRLRKGWPVHGTTSQLFGPLLQSGIGLRRAETGTGKTLSRSELRLHPSNMFALSAPLSFGPVDGSGHNFVRTNAARSTAGTWGLTTLRKSVQNATRLSWQTGTPAGNTVLTVVRNRPTGQSGAVYNLSVEDCPEFFANGVLVHNCAYAYNTWLVEAVKPERLKMMEKVKKMREAGRDETTIARWSLTESRRIAEKEKQNAAGLPLMGRRIGASNVPKG